MIVIISKILTNILIAFYRPFWFAVILSVFFMFTWKNYSDIRSAVKQWIKWFKTEAAFRRMFLLVFYTVMILFGTLLSRDLWMNPLSNVIGNFWIWSVDANTGEKVLITDCLENLVLFIPFTSLLMWNYREKLVGDGRLKRVLWQSAKISFFFSFTIEMLQLFLRLGTWQLSDLFYNTLGGIIGGLIYWCCYKLRYR